VPEIVKWLILRSFIVPFFAAIFRAEFASCAGLGCDPRGRRVAGYGLGDGSENVSAYAQHDIIKGKYLVAGSMAKKVSQSAVAFLCDVVAVPAGGVRWRVALAVARRNLPRRQGSLAHSSASAIAAKLKHQKITARRQKIQSRISDVFFAVPFSSAKPRSKPRRPYNEVPGPARLKQRHQNGRVAILTPPWFRIQTCQTPAPKNRF